jgi:hypothetical protein
LHHATTISIKGEAIRLKEKRPGRKRSGAPQPQRR